MTHLKKFFVELGVEKTVALITASVVSAALTCAIVSFNNSIKDEFKKFNSTSTDEQFRAIQRQLVQYSCKDSATGREWTPPVMDVESYKRLRDDKNCRLDFK